MDIKKFFREKESDKISKEIVGKIYSVEAIEEYFKFGYASALNDLEDMANTYINKGNFDKMDAYDLRKIISETVRKDEFLRETYFKLRKDGTKLDIDDHV